MSISSSSEDRRPSIETPKRLCPLEEVEKKNSDVHNTHQPLEYAKQRVFQYSVLEEMANLGWTTFMRMVYDQLARRNEARILG